MKCSNVKHHYKAGGKITLLNQGKKQRPIPHRVICM